MHSNILIFQEWVIFDISFVGSFAEFVYLQLACVAAQLAI